MMRRLLGSLGAAMLRLYRDASLRERLRELSLERAAAFSWDRCVRETLATYRAVTATAG